jgi:DNA double-strand break repair and V(D)J recombination protein XRCC4
MYTIVNRHI